MSGPLRTAGSGRLADGTVLSWSVAEGTRGRRWRGTTTLDGQLRLVALLELDEGGRAVRLELASVAGMLTVHPSPDGGTLHGNVVRPRGVDHLELAWTPEHELLVEGEPLSLAAAAHRLAVTVGVGETVTRPAIVVDRALRPRAARCRLVRVDGGRWRAHVGAGPALEVALDADGLPVDIRDGGSWPLET